MRKQSNNRFECLRDSFLLLMTTNALGKNPKVYFHSTVEGINTTFLLLFLPFSVNDE